MRNAVCLVSMFTFVDDAYAEETEDEETLEIVVTATKTEVLVDASTTYVEIISSKQIEEFGIGDLTDILQQIAGINVVRSILGSSPVLQGLEPKHTLVLIDGQRLLGNKNGIVDLSRVSLSNIERIEIIRGASSVLYGSDAMGGVINIITKRAKSKKVQLSYQHGSFGMIQTDGHLSSVTKSYKHHSTIGLRGSQGYDLDKDSPQTDGPTFRQVDNL